eukprot:TRINITY_DN57_c0_g2_i1.p1 TRINITY_DN57_c0_g2~~TRINITY_DN57_c0_g2_i1.p1  ORF type:complete len:229 (-),score=69.29 TRINITY_DN57_c0_g2_i1:795-1400(-)
MQQTIELVRETVPNLDDPDDITVECDSVPEPCDVSIQGDASYDITITFNERTVRGTCESEYKLIRKWTATDCALNTATSEQTVYVVDSERPVFTRYPESVTVECDCSDEVVELEAVDNCDLGGESVSFSETTDEGTCKHSFTLKRTWSASDICGNEVEWIQYVHVEDTTPPLFCDDFCDDDYVDEYGVIECDRLPTLKIHL